MTLIATPGSSDSNSYATIAEADVFFSNRLYSTDWTNAIVTDQEAALIWATRLLDEYFMWIGDRGSSEQALAWPRTSAYYDGVLLSYVIIPTLIVNSTCELALSLLKGDRSILSEPSSQGLDSLTIGPIELDFSETDRAELIPEVVMNSCLALSVNKPGMVAIARA